MDVRQIEAFRAVARAGGFSRAARVLHVGQPSLTRSVARLEAALGFQLFSRGKGAARLTVEGEAFLREIEISFSGLDRLRVAAQDIRSFGTGRLRVACIPALSGRFMAEALRHFMHRHPTVSVALQVRPSSTVYEWVAAQQVDLGIATQRAGFSGVDDEQLLTVAAVMLVPKGHRLARLRRAVVPADLSDENFLALAQNDAARQATEAAFRTAEVSPRMRLETGNSATLCALVAAGLGVALVNPVAAADHEGLPIVTRPFQPSVVFDYRLLQSAVLPGNRLTRELAAILKTIAATHENAVQPAEHVAALAQERS